VWWGMVRMPFIQLSEADVVALREVAMQSIRHGLTHAGALAVNAADFAASLQPRRATFVTLHQHGALRGCIGTLLAQQPLVQDVAKQAYAAAFQDPRFPALEAQEVDSITLEISILTPPEIFPVDSEADLIAQVRPGVDGLVLESGPFRGTFLPAVWAQLPEPEVFVQHLKLKAGLPSAGWPAEITVLRYQAQKI